jgi:hypothetical protein
MPYTVFCLGSIFWYTYCDSIRFKEFPLLMVNSKTFCFIEILFFLYKYNLTIHMESYSNIKSSSMLNPLEGSNALFITGYNNLLANDDIRVARDFYLLLMVYVNYFCIPVLSFVLNCLGGFGKGIQSKFSERVNFVYVVVTFFMENKEYISKLAFSKKEQVEFNFLSRILNQKTVLL